MLLVSDEGGKLALWGTGTFYRQGKDLCLVTARHVFDDVALEDVAVPDIGTRGFVTLGSCGAHWPKQDDQDLDVAVIRLNDEQFVARMTAYWRVMDARNVAPLEPRQQFFFVAGYPLEIVQEKVKPLPGRQTITREAFCQFHADRIAVELPNMTTADFFLRYGKTALDKRGNEKKTPNLSAVSGASVWSIQDRCEGMWAPDKILKIVGVQSGFKHDQYIRAKTWDVVREVLRRSD